MGRRRRRDGNRGEEETGAEPAGSPARVSNEHGQVSLAGVIETEKTTADSELRIPT